MIGGWSTLVPDDALIVLRYCASKMPVNWRPWPLGMVCDLVPFPPYVPGETMAAPASQAIASAMMGIIGGAATLGTIASVATIMGIVSWLQTVLEPADDSAGSVAGCQRRASHRQAIAMSARWPMLGVRALASGSTEGPGRALCVRADIGIDQGAMEPNVPLPIMLLDNPMNMVAACGPGAHWSLVLAPPIFVCAAIDAQIEAQR